MRNYEIAVIPGDGIGQKVVTKGVRVLDEAGRRFGLSLTWDPRPAGALGGAGTNHDAGRTAA
jgi:isocitrate/isopropylmalate dehydrogenase